MNGNSKSEKVEAFIRRQVRDALQEMAFNDSQLAPMLRSNREMFELTIAGRIINTYTLMELDDIMHWKKPKKIE